MFYDGLVSVTFRSLTPAAIIGLVVKAGLSGIEWGGDLHVPHGDLAAAQRVGEATRAAGLRVASYGSYYRVFPQQPVDFETVLATAAALGAPMIRVWAGTLASSDSAADAAYRSHLAAELSKIAERAAQAAIGLTLEFHNGTLTDEIDSAVDLLRSVNHPNLGSYWQVVPELDHPTRLAGLKLLLPYLRGLHVFNWRKGQDGAVLRLPLEDAAHEWNEYLHLASGCVHDLTALLEFVLGDDAAQFSEDAKTLKRLTSTAMRY